MISLCILCKQSLSCNSYLFRWSKEKRAGTQVTTFLDKDDEDAGEDRSNEDEVDNENEEDADDDLLNIEIQQIAKELSTDWQTGDCVTVANNYDQYPGIIHDVRRFEISPSLNLDLCNTLRYISPILGQMMNPNTRQC